MDLSKARLRLLRSLRLRKRREKEGKFLVEGVRVIGEALEGKADLLSLIFAEPAADEVLALIREAERRGVETIRVDPDTLRAISTNPSPQGITAVVRKVPARWEGWLAAGKDLLVLDGIQDPGNMGTLIRAGRAFGMGGVLVGKGCVDPHHPKVLRAGAGAHFHLGISDPLEIPSCLEKVKEAGLAVVVADPRGGVPFDRADYPPVQALVLGNEGSGVTLEARRLADLTVRIPLMDGTESINVAVASGILLYHLSRRQKGSQGPDRSHM